MDYQPAPNEELGTTKGVILEDRQPPPRSSLAAIHMRGSFRRSRPVSKTIRRHKLSAEGKEAREFLKYDRSDPMVTTKARHVEERPDAGTWETVHCEHQEFAAKHRP